MGHTVIRGVPANTTVRGIKMNAAEETVAENMVETPAVKTTKKKTKKANKEKKGYKSKLLPVTWTESGKANIAGMTVSCFLKGMGWYGFKAKHAYAVLTELGLTDVSVNTCACQTGDGSRLARGKDMYYPGPAAEFTREDLEEIAALAGLEDVPARPKKEKK